MNEEMFRTGSSTLGPTTLSTIADNLASTHLKQLEKNLHFTKFISDDYKTHSGMLKRYRSLTSSSEGRPLPNDFEYRPVCYVRVPSTRGRKEDQNLNVGRPGSNLTTIELEYYEKIKRQLEDLSCEDEDEKIDSGAVASAQSMVSVLQKQGYAPPMLSWHGGDAVVMLWTLGSETFAITVTEGRWGYVVQRGKKITNTISSLQLDLFETPRLG